MQKNSFRSQASDVEYHASNRLPSVLDVSVSISEEVSRSIFHSNLKELTLREPRFVGKRNFWSWNQKSRVHRTFTRSLFSCKKLKALKLKDVIINERCWNMVTRLSHCLPFLERFVFQVKRDGFGYRDTIVAPNLLYFCMMMPQRLKLLRFDGCFSSTFWTACLRRRVSEGFAAESIKCSMYVHPGLEQDVRRLLPVAERQDVIDKITVSKAVLLTLLVHSTGKQVVDFLESLTPLAFTSGSVTIHQIRHETKLQD